MTEFVLEARTDADVPILDLTTVDIPLTVTGAPPGINVTFFEVFFTINHTYDADLDISLIDPDGNIIDLSSDNGGGENNYTNTIITNNSFVTFTWITAGTPPFTGAFLPEQMPDIPLPGTVNGIWTLRITDDLGSDTGFLDFVRLKLTYFNEPAIGVMVIPAVAAVNEGTLTVATKVADIALDDFGGGLQNFTLIGADAGSFQVIGSELFLIAGAVLDFESKPTLSVQVAVDDPTVGSAPDAVSAVFTLTVGNLIEPTGVLVNPAGVAVNEGTLTAATKVADIAVLDSDGGFHNFSLLGDDAGSFQVIGNELFLNAGAVLDFEVKPTLSVQVAVDDPTIGGDPDAVSAVYTFAIGNVTPEILLGTDGNDVLSGNVDRDLIFAGLGNDVLAGGPGFDLLVGGRGADVMSGGPGEDIYDFNSKKDTGKTAATRDKILDFEHAIDAIDLRGIDAKFGPGNQAFKSIAKLPFSDTPGELHYVKVDKPGTVNDKTIVEGDTNGDGLADFQIELSRLVNLAAADFFL